MRKWLGAVLLLSIALLNQSCAPKSQEACGFVQNVYGERISWKADAPVKLYLHSSVPDQYIQAIHNAASTWEKTAGRKLFDIQDTKLTDNGPQKDGVNVIYWMKTWEDNRASEQARTSVYWVGDQIKETDIRINSKNFDFYWNTTPAGNQVNIEALVLHEMGHVLGLKHKDDSGSVMATYLAAGTSRNVLAPADQTDLKCEY